MWFGFSCLGLIILIGVLMKLNYKVVLDFIFIMVVLIMLVVSGLFLLKYY